MTSWLCVSLSVPATHCKCVLPCTLCRSELIWQLRQKGSSKWKTVDEELRSKLEAAYKQDPKAVLKEEELHVRLASV